MTPVRIPLSDVTADDELVDAVAATLRSGWWSSGPRVAEFERAFADFTGARHAIACANGTAALHLALLGCGVQPGDDVVMPSLTFVASANTARLAGATPVFCDITGAGDLNLDPQSLEAVLTRRTRAVVVLHYAGFPCDMDAVREIAERNGLIVIEDAAHAPGATWRGASCGTLGDAGCFSFFANKNLPIGEGGMVVTDDDGLAERIRLLRSHGMTRFTWDSSRGHASSYDVTTPGLNYRLDEVRATVGLVQLRRLPSENETRARLAARYMATLDSPYVELPFADPDLRGVSSHHLAVILVPAAVRDSLREVLADAGIQTSVHYPPVHSFAAYARDGAELPRTTDLAARLVSLPLYGGMTEADVDAVVGAVHAGLRKLVQVPASSKV